jgi:glucose/arabinose dehydrogenase
MTDTDRATLERRAVAGVRIAPLALAAMLLALSLAGSASIARSVLPDGFRDTLIAGGFDQPVGMTFVDSRRLLVVEERTAQIRLLVDGALSATDPVLRVPGVRTSGCEQGLLGIAIDPGWPARPYVYLHMDDSASTTIRVTRYTVGGDVAFAGNGALTIDVTTRRDILTGVPDNACNHNGGTLRFGNDGMLYASFGEDANMCAAQDTLSMLGVILRLDVSGVPAGGGPAPTKASIVAAGNPLAGHVDPRSRLIWLWGLRNPFRFQVDPSDGVLYISDVGANIYEEMDRAPTGGLNFGWPIAEGPIAGPGAGSCTLNGAATPPIHAYDRSGEPDAVMICAGVYRYPAGLSGDCPNCLPSDYVGDLFFSDFYMGFFRRLKGSGNSWSLAAPVAGQPSATDFGTGYDGVSDYTVGPDGALWYVSLYNGEVRAIAGGGGTVTTPPPPPPPVPISASLDPPYPTPSNGIVQLPYTLSRAARVSIRLYDIRGRLVRVLMDGASQSPGAAPAVWDGRDDDRRVVPAGIYVAQMDADGARSERRVVLLK